MSASSDDNENSQKPYGFRHGYLVLKQGDREAFELASTRDCDGGRPAAGDDLEVVELHFQRHRPAPRALVVAVPPDLVDQRLQFGGHRVEFGEIAGERVLRADRFPDSVRADLPLSTPLEIQ